MITEQANAIATTMAELLDGEGVKFTAPVYAELLDANGDCFYAATRAESGETDAWHPLVTPSPVGTELLVYDLDGHSAKFFLLGGYCARCL